MAGRNQTNRQQSPSRRLKTDASEFTPGTPSDFVLHFHDVTVIRQFPEMIAFYRVSGRWPNWRDRLNRGLANVRSEVEAHGIEILGEFREVGSGWKRDDRLVFLAAITEAKERNVPLVTTTTCRFVRNEQYPEVDWPTVADLQHLERMADGVPLITILNPDAPQETCRRYLQDVGQRATGNRGGRPTKHRRGPYQPRTTVADIERLIPMIGIYSVRQIEQMTNCPKSTVHDRIKKARKLIASRKA